MQIYDISLPLTETLAVWPGDAPTHIEPVYQLAQGDTATVSRLAMSAHTGTHVDAPRHYVAGGAGVDALDLSTLIGPALVVEVPHDTPVISAALLDALAIPPGAVRILFHTANSQRWAAQAHVFHKDYVAVNADGARWLVERGVKLVGIDCLSIAPFDDLEAPHRLLLNANVVVVEGLNLTGVAAGMYELVCLPLKIANCDGAPARAVLIQKPQHNST
jgi:arylformamidase